LDNLENTANVWIVVEKGDKSALRQKPLMCYQHLNSIAHVANAKGDYELVVPLAAQFFVPQDEREEEEICQKDDQCHQKQGDGNHKRL